MTIARIDRDPMPARIHALPRSKAGYPVPWFVTWINGEPDFRVITVPRLIEAATSGLCWTCGEPLGRERIAFVIGPMCAVNRTSGEPPSHLSCAEYAAVHCPFLSIPKMHRREKGKPEGSFMHSGGLRRNPGVTLVWIATPPVHAFPTEGTLLFDVGEPAGVRWYAEGREATRTEVEASIGSGLPALQAIAAEEGPDAVAELSRLHERALALLPA